MCKIFCRHAVVASELTRELTLGATAYGGGAGRAFGHADPAAAGWLGGLALSKATEEPVATGLTLGADRCDS